MDEQKPALKPLCPSSSSSSASSSHSKAVSWGRTRQAAWLRPRAEEAGAEIWGSEPGWRRKASTQGSESQHLWSMATGRKTDQTAIGVDAARLLTAGAESHKYGEGANLE